MKYQISYGKGTISIEVPDERVAGILSPKKVSGVDDVISSVRTAINKPYGSQPLENILEDKKNALILTVNKPPKRYHFERK